MPTNQESIDLAINDLESLKRLLKKKTAVQVSTVDEKSLIKATALTWFNNHREIIIRTTDGLNMGSVDSLYSQLLLGVDRATTRKKCFNLMKDLRVSLTGLRSTVLASALKNKPSSGSDIPLDFSLLIKDSKMITILHGRWSECVICISAGAPLSAVIMMGGLLEGLLLARINSHSDKTAIFTAKAAPKDRAGKTLAQKEWGLKNYLDVAHELGWITQSAKDVGSVLRDYRNYVHPEKQLSGNLILKDHDAILFWELTKSLSRQLVNS
jgi:hypothetical protein